MIALFAVDVFVVVVCVVGCGCRFISWARKLLYKNQIIDFRTMFDGWECCGEVPGVLGASRESQGAQEPRRDHERPGRGHELLRGAGSPFRLKCAAIPKMSQGAFHFM